MTAVRDLVRALNDAGVPASFDNTGGGCMAIRVTFGPVIGSHDLRPYEVLITERIAGPFDLSDYDNDGELSGFNAGLYFYGPDGERTLDDSVLVYVTSEDAGVSASEAADARDRLGRDAVAVDLGAESRACLKAVTGVVTLVRNATLIARSGERLSW